MGNSDTAEIRIAVFGESGSGKTTLLSTFFGRQQSEEFISESEYYLRAEKKSQQNELLANYYGLEKGEFPQGTINNGLYSFWLEISKLEQKESALKISWLDYPGKWWIQDEIDDEGKKRQKECLEILMSSHVGILVVDGAKYLKDKENYIRKLFDNFKNEFKKIKRESMQKDKSKKGKKKDDKIGPDKWIIALSKADLIPDFKAYDFSKEIIRLVGRQFGDIDEKIDANGFGDRYLLLASVKCDASGQIISDTTIGIDCIAPASLIASIENAKRIKVEMAKSSKLSWLNWLKSFILDIDKYDDFLPIKYQVITKLIKKFKLEEIINEHIDASKKRCNDCIQASNVLEATVAAMLAILKKSKELGIYYECK